MTFAAPRAAPAFTGPPGQEDMPWLLTPGPLTTSQTVKLAMMADWGSRDREFLQMVWTVRKNLLRLAHCGPDYDCVLMQGSGTFAMEAALGSFCPAVETKTLVMANGIYGARAAAILKRIRRRHLKIEKEEGTPLAPGDVAALLDADPAISHVWVVHCETATGIINPLQEIARVVKRRNRTLMVDAMSSFGALPLDMETLAIDVMVSSSDKCLEGVPGFSYVLAKRQLLMEAKDKCHSLVLDLFAQWKSLDTNGYFRFTPPTHAVVALHEALKEHHREGGVAARGNRYARTAQALLTGMREMGFTPLLGDTEAGPLIQTFLGPKDPNFDVEYFQEALRTRGFIIYQGPLSHPHSFSIGTIGHTDEKVVRLLLTALRYVLRDMNVTNLAPA